MKLHEPTMFKIPIVRVATIILLLAMGAWSKQPTDGQSGDTSQADHARLHGLLVYRLVTVDFDGVPARDALASLRRQASLPLIVRWKDDAAGLGIDPDCAVSLTMEKRPALEVLEEILLQCGKPAGNSECIWQLRRGFIEAGTKERLAVPAARTVQLYDIRDLMIEAPDFGGSRDGDRGRKTPQALAVEVVEKVCETIEPGRWDYGQPAPAEDDRLDGRPIGVAGSTPAASAPPATAPDAGAASPATPASPQPRSRSGIQQWASIRVWRDQLIVVAPDFIHRQIGGYPDPVPPDDATEDPAQEEAQR